MNSTPWMSDIVVGSMRWGVFGANFPAAQYEQMIEASIESAFTTFDHADIYGDHKVAYKHKAYDSLLSIALNCEQWYRVYHAASGTLLP